MEVSMENVPWECSLNVSLMAETRLYSNLCVLHIPQSIQVKLTLTQAIIMHPFSGDKDGFESGDMISAAVFRILWCDQAGALFILSWMKYHCKCNDYHHSESSLPTAYMSACVDHWPCPLCYSHLLKRMVLLETAATEEKEGSHCTRRSEVSSWFYEFPSIFAINPCQSKRCWVQLL